MAEKKEDRSALNRELAQMFKGGVIMDVTTPEQAKIAEEAGACAVMALERIPADIRAAGGVSRMSDPAMIRGIQKAVSIPVMAKCRIGHFVEAQLLEAIEIDYIDESEVLSPADDVYHIDKTKFRVPFVCGARDIGEALRRIAEGASMIRTKGEPGTGDIIQAVHHMRKMNQGISHICSLREDELGEEAKALGAPLDRAVGLEESPSSRREFRGRRHRHPRRCCAHDAARRRMCLRGIWHIQIRGSGKARQGHCPGHDELYRRRPHRQTLRKSRPRHGRHQRRRDRNHHGRSRRVIAL